MTNALLIVALTLFGEAAGEPLEGKRAVASVIWNRAGGDPSALVAVCRAPRQFSCWNDGAAPRVPRDAPSRRAWAVCADIAGDMVAGTFVPTTCATHYHNTTVRPRWAERMREIDRIGRHRFYHE